MKFTLTIESDNAAMRKAEHVVSALREVAQRVRDGSDSGRIRDINGNTVGEFELVDDEED